MLWVRGSTQPRMAIQELLSISKPLGIITNEKRSRQHYCCHEVTVSIVQLLCLCRERVGQLAQHSMQAAVEEV